MLRGATIVLTLMVAGAYMGGCTHEKVIKEDDHGGWRDDGPHGYHDHDRGDRERSHHDDDDDD